MAARQYENVCEDNIFNNPLISLTEQLLRIVLKLIVHYFVTYYFTLGITLEVVGVLLSEIDSSDPSTV